MSDFIDKLVDASISPVKKAGQALGVVPKAAAPQVVRPVAPTATREQAQASSDALIAQTRKRRQISSSVVQGIQKRSTLG